jgi:hypothetical protein
MAHTPHINLFALDHVSQRRLHSAAAHAGPSKHFAPGHTLNRLAHGTQIAQDLPHGLRTLSN